MESQPGTPRGPEAVGGVDLNLMAVIPVFSRAYSPRPYTLVWWSKPHSAHPQVDGHERYIRSIPFAPCSRRSQQQRRRCRGIHPSARTMSFMPDPRRALPCRSGSRFRTPYPPIRWRWGIGIRSAVKRRSHFSVQF